MDSNIERWYSMKEICEYLGVSRDTVLAWIERRKNKQPFSMNKQIFPSGTVTKAVPLL